MAATAWIDTKPVYSLSTECSTALITVGRRVAPQFNKFRLHNSSETRTIAWVEQPLMIKTVVSDPQFKEPCGSRNIITRYLSVIYIIYTKLFARKYPDKLVPSHCQVMDDMQVALLAVGPSDFEGDLSIEAMFGSVPRSHARHRSVTPGRHELEQVDNFRVARVGDKTQRTSRPYAYKVCSILRRAPNKPAWETTYLCRTCSNAHGSGVVYLCQRARQHDPTGPLNTATCSQIWHDMWRNGTDTPEGHWYRRRVPQNGLGSSRNADSEESEEEVQ